MNAEEQDLLQELSTSTAVTAAVALAEYSSFYDLLIKSASEGAKEQGSLLENLRSMVREQALMLLLLSRSISEYGKKVEGVPPEDDPRILQPLLQEIGSSYALFALAERGTDIQTGLVLSPDRLEEILTPEVADFISRFGEAEAVRILEERKNLYEKEFRSE